MIEIECNEREEEWKREENGVLQLRLAELGIRMCNVSRPPAIRSCIKRLFLLQLNFLLNNFGFLFMNKWRGRVFSICGTENYHSFRELNARIVKRTIFIAHDIPNWCRKIAAESGWRVEDDSARFLSIFCTESKKWRLRSECVMREPRRKFIKLKLFFFGRHFFHN